MRTTIVPAQVTTVEDKIAGSLGVSQLLLLITPIFFGSGLFVVLPPFFQYATYKLVVITCLIVLCGLCAIRIKGKILLLWVVVLCRYNVRPRYFVLNKNDMHTRELVVEDNRVVVDDTPPVTVSTVVPRLSVGELVAVESLVGDPVAGVYFRRDRKGVLNVHLTEVKQESVNASAD